VKTRKISLLGALTVGTISLLGTGCGKNYSGNFNGTLTTSSATAGLAPITTQTALVISPSNGTQLNGTLDGGTFIATASGGHSLTGITITKPLPPQALQAMGGVAQPGASSTCTYGPGTGTQDDQGNISFTLQAQMQAGVGMPGYPGYGAAGYGVPGTPGYVAPGTPGYTGYMPTGVVGNPYCSGTLTFSGRRQ
jgi:hypothetical protein